jgi:alpha-1,2-mannosyltransferase
MANFVLVCPGEIAHDGFAAAVRQRVGGWRIRVFAALYAVSAAAGCALAATSKGRFVDQHVYRMGGEAVLHGANLYALHYQALPFTYPPFSAIVFAGIAPLPWLVGAALVTVASAVVLPLMLYLALRLPPLLSWLDRRDAWRLAFAAAAAAIWLEPVRTAMGYGQIDLFLAAAVLYDLTLPDTARRKGVAIGLAAGIKLTPAIFVVYLLLTRRFRAAATAMGVFAATIAAGFAGLPSASAHFWDGTFLNPSRISPVQDPQNESLMGAMSRTLHTADVQHAWMPLAILVALAGLALAAGAQRRGNEAAGFCLCAITGLLISPISWTHHWVIAVPALLIAAVTIYRDRIRFPDRVHKRLARGLAVVALGALAVIGWGRLVNLAHSGLWLHFSAFSIAASEIYVLAALATLALAAGLALVKRLGGRRDTAPGRHGHPEVTGG